MSLTMKLQIIVTKEVGFGGKGGSWEKKVLEILLRVKILGGNPGEQLESL